MTNKEELKKKQNKQVSGYVIDECPCEHCNYMRLLDIEPDHPAPVPTDIIDLITHHKGERMNNKEELKP